MSKRSSKSSSSNGFNSEMFTDLHLKMSKKIAQLTKVIYHLNTRNEDFSIDLKAEKQSHANEVYEILQDAADKINKFKSQLAKAKQNSATANALKKLRKQHEEERDEAMGEFSKYKERVQKREDSLRKEFKQKVNNMKKDLDCAKKKFKQRLKDFNEAQERLKSNQSISNDELNKLKQAHQEEIDELVKKTNNKYNNMLNERMDMEDTLRKEHEMELKKLRKELNMKHQNEINELTKSLNEKHVNEMKQQQVIADEKFQQAQNKLVTKMEKLLSDLEDLRKQETIMREKNEQLERKVPMLENEIKDLKEKLKSEQLANETMAKNASGSQKEMQDMLKSREKRIAELTKELQELKVKSSKQQTTIDSD